MHTQTGRLLLNIGHTYITQFYSQHDLQTGWYVHTCVRACVRAYVHAHGRTYVHMFLRVYPRMCVHSYVRACVSAYLYTCVRTCVCACVRECVHACVRVCARALVHTIDMDSLVLRRMTYWPKQSGRMILITSPATPDDGETRGEDNCRKYMQVCFYMIQESMDSQ